MNLSINRFRLALAAVFCGALALTLLMLHAIAHAQAAAAPSTPTPDAPGLSVAQWIAVGLGALAGVKAIVDVLLGGFRWLAPRTSTSVDDSIRDDLQLAHDKLDSLTALVQGMGIRPAAPAAAPAPPASKPGHVAAPILLALSFLGLLGIAVAGSGCAGSTQASRHATLSTAVIVANTAIKSVQTYDQVTGDAIVKSAPDKAKGEADLAKLRARVGAAIKACTAALDAIGVANSLNDDHSLEGVKTALDQAITAVTALTGGK